MKVTAEYNLAKIHPNIAKEIFIPENEFKDSVDSAFSDIKGRSLNKPDLLIIDQNINNMSLDRPISDKNGYFRLLPLLSKNGIKKIGEQHLKPDFNITLKDATVSKECRLHKEGSCLCLT